MGQLLINLKAIFEDLKSSWYFRIWALFWSVCFIVALLGFGVYAATSVISGSEKDWNVWVENATSLTFPRFHFRLPHDSKDVFTQKSCSHNGQVLQTSACVYHDLNPPLDKCFAINGEAIIVSQDWNAPETDEMIVCNIRTSAVSNNEMIGWATENSMHFGGPYHTLWIASTENAWVELEKSYVKPAGYNKPDDSNLDHGFPVYNKHLVYHSTLHNAGNYTIVTYLKTFRVEHLEQGDFFNGWMALGGTGGLTYFLIILHTMAMILVGIVFTNDSKFLSSQNTDGERSMM